MLQSIRDRIQGIVTITIIVFIGLAFIFLGFSDYFSLGGQSRVAAKVNGEKISWQAVEALYERLQRQYGEKIDSNTLSSLKDQSRYFLVQRAALLSSAKKLGFRVGENQIADTLLQIPVFQVDGQFSKERYLQVLRDAAYTDQSFRQELQQDVLLSQLEQGLMQSSFSLNSELTRIIELLNQTRDMGFAILPVQKYKNGINVSKEEIETYYDGHKTRFVVPEQVAVEYVELSIDNIAKDIAVEKAEIDNYYNEHKASYGAPERVRARHILISVPQNGSAEEDKKAKEEALAILAKLKSGENFEELAKKHSKDPGSLQKGGDLGWFTKGQMDKAFEKASFELKNPKELSEPVRSSYGYHIIQLIEHKQADVRPLTEVQALIKEQIQKEKAQSIFLEKGEQLAKLSFEQAGSLTPIVEKLGLKIEQTPLFTRQGGKDKLSNNPDIVKAAFSEEIMLHNNNSEPLKVAEGSLIVMRAKQHVPAKQQTLAEVENKIKEGLTFEKARAKAKEASDEILKRIRSGENPAKLAKELGLQWTIKKGLTRNSEDIDRSIVALGFRMPHPESPSKPKARALLQPSGDVVILALNEVHEGDLSKVDANTRQGFRQSLSETIAQLEFALYATKTMSEAKIEIAGQTAKKE